MRTLYLLRHAKSTWKDESLADYERPLARRGRDACLKLARFIQSRELEFDLILCSTAVRARETLDLIRQHSKLRTEVRYDERIYEASAIRLLEVASQIDSDRKSVLIVGHNPGLEDLLHVITGQQLHLTTGNLARIKLKISKWSESYENKATLDWIIRPKELDQS